MIYDLKLKPIERYWVEELQKSIEFIKNSDICLNYVKENLKNVVEIK